MSNNPNDPLLKSGPEQQRALFEAMAQCAHGFSTEQVLGASINMLVNAVRQSASTRSAAQAALNEVHGKTMNLLMQHYDSVTGKRLSVFPFTQTIELPRYDDNAKKNVV